MGDFVNDLIVIIVNKLMVKANQIPRVSLRIIGGKYKRKANSGRILYFIFDFSISNANEIRASKADVVA